MQRLCEIGRGVVYSRPLEFQVFVESVVVFGYAFSLYDDNTAPVFSTI